MFRVLIWALIAAGLVAFLAFAGQGNKMPEVARLLVYGMVSLLVMCFFAWGIAWRLYVSWTTGGTFLTGVIGGGQIFWRDEQPVRYWAIMIVHIILLVIVIWLICLMLSRTLIPEVLGILSGK